MESQDFLDKNAVVMVDDPVSNASVKAMKETIALILTEQELADAFAKVSNKFWWIEDDLYDFEPGTREYAHVRAMVDAWGAMLKELSQRITAIMERDSILMTVGEGKSHSNIYEPFMKRYGYRDGCGWWIREKG